MHVFRKQVTEPSTQEEVCEPDTSVNTEKEDEELLLLASSQETGAWCT